MSERPHGADRCHTPQCREGGGRRDELRPTGTDDGQRRVAPGCLEGAGVAGWGARGAVTPGLRCAVARPRRSGDGGDGVDAPASPSLSVAPLRTRRRRRRRRRRMRRRCVRSVTGSATTCLSRWLRGRRGGAGWASCLAPPRPQVERGGRGRRRGRGSSQSLPLVPLPVMDAPVIINDEAVQEVRVHGASDSVHRRRLDILVVQRQVRGFQWSFRSCSSSLAVDIPFVPQKLIPMVLLFSRPW